MFTGAPYALYLSAFLLVCMTAIAITLDADAEPASYYGHELGGALTASGEPFDPESFTVAHRTLPLGTVVVVCNNYTGLCQEAVVSDRGPWVGHREWDVSLAVARAIGGLDAGVMDVSVTVL